MQIKYRVWDKENKKYIGLYYHGLYVYENGEIYLGNMNVTNRFIT